MNISGPTAPSRRHERALQALSAVTLVITCVFAGKLHAFFWHHAGQYGGDDGYTMALGERLIDGSFLPYVDGCSHRGPLLYWVAALSQLVTGRFGWLGARVLSITTTTATLLAVFGVGMAARRPVAGAIAAVFFTWSVLCGLAVSPAFAITGEALASPLAVASLLFVTLACAPTTPIRTRFGSLVVAGVFAGLAGLSKQTALPIIAPLALWVIASSDAIGWRQRLASVTPLSLGFTTTLGAIVLLYVARGQFHAFWYWYYSYNAHVYMTPYRGANFVGAFEGFVRDNPWSVRTFAIFVAWGLLSPFVVVHAWRPRLRGFSPDAGLPFTTASIALALFAAGVAPMRFWPHYFLPVFPFVGILIGCACDAILNAASGRLLAIVASFLVLAAGTTVLGRSAEDHLSQWAVEANHGGWPAETWEPICNIINANSKPGESLFAWGFSGDLYLTCRRRPASRYVYLTLVAGTVPPFWSAIRADRIAEGARENLISDLKKERPPVVLDVPEAMGNVSLLDIPIVQDFVTANYCKRSRERIRHGNHATVWIRRDLSGCRDNGG